MSFQDYCTLYLDAQINYLFLCYTASRYRLHIYSRLHSCIKSVIDSCKLQANWSNVRRACTRSRWAGVCIWMGGSYSAGSCFSVWESLDELRLPLFMWSREESLTDRAKDSWETWGQREILRWGDSTSDLRLHISFICFSETSHLIFISPQQSLVLEFHYCVLLFFWACLPALWLRYALNLHVLEMRTRRVLYALRVYVRCRKKIQFESF